MADRATPAAGGSSRMLATSNLRPVAGTTVRAFVYLHARAGRPSSVNYLLTGAVTEYGLVPSKRTCRQVRSGPSRRAEIRDTRGERFVLSPLNPGGVDYGNDRTIPDISLSELRKVRSMSLFDDAGVLQACGPVLIYRPD